VAAIGLFYGAGFFYGERTHLSVMEYWRWWVVHLWVEGFFEVFATTALAFIFVTHRSGVARMATVASLASASLFMLGGMCRHLPPPVFLRHHHAGDGGRRHLQCARSGAADRAGPRSLGELAPEGARAVDGKLKWPLMCFVAVAFWNMLGAGVFGFMINPPISLYYMQGLNTTPVHAHAALFGVYGFLALGFTLLVLRYLRPHYRSRAPDEDRLLGAQCRPGADDFHQPAADRVHPVPRQRERRPVVRTQRGLHAAAPAANAALGADLRRRGVHRRRRIAGQGASDHR
jgi:nitric oxide reductase subunit B